MRLLRAFVVAQENRKIKASPRYAKLVLCISELRYARRTESTCARHIPERPSFCFVQLCGMAHTMASAIAWRAWRARRAACIPQYTIQYASILQKQPFTWTIRADELA